MVTEKAARTAIPPDSWISRFVDVMEERTDAPVGFAVGAAYAACSLLVPEDMCIQFGGPVHGHQYVCLIGESGDTRKTVAVGYARRAVKAWDPALVFDEPESERGLAEDLADHPQALLALGEMGTFLGGTEKRSYKSGLRTRLTALWDGDSWSRKTKDNPVVIETPRMSVLGGVAPSFLEEHLTPHDFDGGFLNRFLLIYSDRERNFPIPPIMDQPELHAEWGNLRADAQVSWSPCAGWEKSAEKYWAKWVAMCHRVWGANPRMKGFIARASPLALKATLALSVVLGKSTAGDAWKVSKDLLQWACRLATLHLKSVETLLGQLSMDPFSRLRRDVLRTIAHKGGKKQKGATLANILQALSAGGRARKKRDVVEVLETLVAEQHLEIVVRSGKKNKYRPYRKEEVEL